MKKILIALLIFTLSIGLVACGNKDSEVTTDEVVTTTEPVEDGTIAPEVDENTVGGQHWAAFVEEKTANPDITAEELANKLVTLSINQFMGGAMPIEEGLLSGFENYEVKGFESGAMFAPMIGSIAYVGYVFDLADGADVNAFISGLTENANPRWNICVTADQTVVGAIDNTVFFLMCPETYEMPEMGEGEEEIGGEVETEAVETEEVAEATTAVATKAETTTKAPAKTEAPVETTTVATTKAPVVQEVVVKPVSTTEPVVTTTVATTTVAPETTVVVETTKAPAEVTTPAVNITAPKIDGDSVGGQHWNAFSSAKLANPGATAEELANAAVSLPINQFMAGTMPIEEGYLSGFENYEVKGFESGAMFAPMIGSIPYVGYVFELPEGADVNAFMKGLTDNANVRWNICVAADQTVCGAINNTVFFLMCPESYDAPAEGGDMGGMALD
ncbi:MAG: hypothetical protein IJA60_07625 [Clostridia bacterium]|nr:hypothetical protein [Clostridia bacterium]